MFLSCSVHVSDVSGLEQELSRRCDELSDKKADKDFVLSILKAVRQLILMLAHAVLLMFLLYSFIYYCSLQ